MRGQLDGIIPSTIRGQAEDDSKLLTALPVAADMESPDLEQGDGVAGPLPGQPLAGFFPPKSKESMIQGIAPPNGFFFLSGERKSLWT